MKFISYQNLNGKQNMAIDEALLEFAITNNSEPILRLYGWNEPTLSFGTNQKIPNTLKFPHVKRITGGRALLHNQELTYCFVVSQDFLSQGENVLQSYFEISNALIEGFKNLDIILEYPTYKKVSVKSGYCMNIATGTDLSYQNKKLIGSAQMRKKDYILQHGSILLDYDINLLESLFNEKIEHITSLKKISPDITLDQLCFAIKTGFEKVFDSNCKKFDFSI